MGNRAVLLLTVAAAMLLAFSGVVLAQQGGPTTAAEDSPSYRGQNGGQIAPGKLIVKLKDGATEQDLETLNRSVGASTDKRLAPNGLVDNLYRVNVGRGTERQGVGRYQRAGDIVEYAEPDYLRFPDEITTTTDPYYDQCYLWGLYNTGKDKCTGSTNGTADADIDASIAWDTTQGVSDPKKPVAVIDTGIDINHPDINENIWRNPDEIAGNGKDDDNGGKGNGYVDDVYGWDFHSDNNSVYDSARNDEHGTHVAGTIGAEKGNGTGVVGVNWNVDIMPLKFLGPAGGYTSNAVDALDYAVAEGAIASNNSWGGGGYNRSLYEAIDRARNYDRPNDTADGHLFVAAAGNEGVNNDSDPHYPSSYGADDAATSSTYSPNFTPLDNVISVASTTRSDAKSGFSNYGLKSVDLGAPGSVIYSTLPSKKYGSKSGTSMATPHVTGTVALLWAAQPTSSAVTVKDTIIRSVKPNTALSTSGSTPTVTGGGLNACKALGGTTCNPTP